MFRFFFEEKKEKQEFNIDVDLVLHGIDANDDT